MRISYNLQVSGYLTAIFLLMKITDVCCHDNLCFGPRIQSRNSLKPNLVLLIFKHSARTSKKTQR
jgi:hypothetical protein